MLYNLDMKLREITIVTTSIASELVADIFEELGSKGVGIYDREDFDNLDKNQVLWDYVSDNVLNMGKDVLVKGYFNLDEEEQKLEEIAKRLDFLRENSPFELGSLDIQKGLVDDEDWIENWKATQQPVVLGKITICPSWIDMEDDDYVVRIDAGSAFGSGQHETTSMCVELMQSIGLDGKNVVDVGTGSGILGICAVKLGAMMVDGYDIDDNAVKVAKENAILNNVADRMFVDNANLLDKTNKKYDVVLANITADVLICLGDNLKNYVSQDGDIIISGIIKDRESDIVNAFENKGYKIAERKNDGEWIAFRMKV